MIRALKAALATLIVLGLCPFLAFAEDCDLPGAREVYDLKLVNDRTAFKGNSLDLARALVGVINQNQDGFARIQLLQSAALANPSDRSGLRAQQDKEAILLKMGLSKSVKALFGKLPNQFVFVGLVPDVISRQDASLTGFQIVLNQDWIEGQFVWKKEMSLRMEATVQFSDVADMAEVCFARGGCHALSLSNPLNSLHSAGACSNQVQTAR